MELGGGRDARGPNGHSPNGHGPNARGRGDLVLRLHA